MRREYYKQQKAKTDRDSTIAEQEKARADQERAIADQRRYEADRPAYRDKMCEGNCDTSLSSCKSDCEWNKKKANANWCGSNCISEHRTCLEKCGR